MSRRILSIFAPALLGSALMGSAVVTAPAVNAQATQERPESFAALAKRLSPAVVNISTAQNIEANVEMPEFPKGSPLERFNDFFGNGDSRVAASLGSGFVIDPEGYIATNNHVIEGADIIEVSFPNGDSYVATLLGRDPSTDVALLKIDANEPIPHVDWADSDTAEVGDWVVAIGNPFGYNGTVTAGIVSARNRGLGVGNYDQFIQSDVAINKGNSGGPLFNMAGDVVGMNTAIVSPTGGSVGISFTTPSNIVADVVEQLKAFGETRRGFLGVSVQEVSEATAKKYGQKAPTGALINKVTKDSPAEKSGLKRGDLITAFDGAPLIREEDLALMVAQAEIGSTVEVRYIRGKKERTASVDITRLKEKVTKDDIEQVEPADAVALGIAVESLTDAVRRKYRIDPDAKGVRVTGIARGSDAAGKLRINDVIEEVELETIEGVDDFASKVKAAKDEDTPIMLLINRGGNYLFYSLIDQS